MPPRRHSPLEIKVTEPHLCSVDLRLKILGKVPFFKDLPQAALKQINALFHEKGYAADEMICSAGDPAERLFVIADGRVRLLRHSLTGKEILLDILAAGEFFGSLSTVKEDVYQETAQAQTQACVLTISREVFRQILDQQPSVALKVLDIMSARLQASNERVHQLSVLPVEGRIASVLLRLGDKFGERHEAGLLIQVPLSRTDLAAMTGTTTESASRVMSQFQKDGLIQSGREWVSVTDREGLEAIAGSEFK
jgi:CRP/FNR family transcriptional regulator, nitrogen oxide reductase regulator